MKQALGIVIVIMITCVHTSCNAGCNCDDWVLRGGYCVNYVKSRIPTFPIPKNTSEITALKNKETAKVTVGDVAMFNFGNYWHVAYVEKVHMDKHGNSTAIDVSEMNFGRQISINEYKNRWGTKDENEWKRALCCGVTDKYDQTSMRTNIALNNINHIWSPVSNVSNKYKPETQ